MDKEYIEVMEDSPISFENFLKLCSAYYIDEVLSRKRELIAAFEKALVPLKIADIRISDESTERYIMIRVYIPNSTTGELVTYSLNKAGIIESVSFEFYGFNINRSVAKTRSLSLFEGKRLIEFESYLNFFARFEFNTEFELHNQKFDLSLDCPSATKGNLLRIIISNTGNRDEYYYDLETRTLLVSANGELKPLSKTTKAKILSSLPSGSLSNQDSPFRRYITSSNPIYKTEDGKVIAGSPTLIDRFRYGSITKGNVIMVPMLEEKKEEKSLSFSQVLTQSGTDIELGKNINEIKESIKSILVKLKGQDFDRSDFVKIQISEDLFFKSIAPGRKEIDPFFQDPKIMELCDLSKIDFTNADIAGFSFEGTDATITLSTVYNSSIKGCNLKGINLYYQDLNGIVADEADLRETGVFVEIDKASIIGAKFSSSTSFMYSGQMISDDIARKMGIHIEDEKESPITLLTRSSKSPGA